MTGSKFVNITAEEMAAFLEPKGFSRMQLDGTVELVWGKVVRTDDGCPVSLRVYSSINPSGQSRGYAQDAIQVQLYWRENKDAPIVHIGGSAHVKRMANWREHLGARIDGWQENTGPRCECGRFMVLKTPRAGQTWKPFYGCVGWRKDRSGCNRTQQYNPPAGEEAKPKAKSPRKAKKPRPNSLMRGEAEIFMIESMQQ